MEEYLTDEDLVKKGLALADIFYTRLGNKSRPDYKYFDSTHPQELLMWVLACDAFDFICGTDLDDSLRGLDE